MEDKNFSNWMNVKARLHCLSKGPMIKEGEVYWCALGENIATEINGKNKAFSRPVLIYKKFSTDSFLGIPLTSKQHEGTWYVPFVFLGKTETAVLSQARTMSAHRLYDRMGELDDVDMKKIQQGFHELFCNK